VTGRREVAPERRVRRLSRCRGIQKEKNLLLMLLITSLSYTTSDLAPARNGRRGRVGVGVALPPPSAGGTRGEAMRAGSRGGHSTKRHLAAKGASTDWGATGQDYSVELVRNSSAFDALFGPPFIYARTPAASGPRTDLSASETV